METMKIISVKRGSQAEEKGLKAGDRVVEVNGGPARDYIDLMFYGSEERVSFRIHRSLHEFVVYLNGEEDFGVEFEPFKMKTCHNRCIFCFIDQNPPGMRKDIYCKDEDYRMSFLYGSYISLTGLQEEEFQRIVSQRLSPLYVSVHATDPAARLKLLGIKKNDLLMENIERLVRAGIALHCQVVVCPGINDGEILKRTLTDLHSWHPGILSVAVVPVGLTKHREGLFPLEPVRQGDARSIIKIADTLNTAYRAESGAGFVYCTDELYIRAGLAIPGEGYYDEFPQFENGVGMVRDFLDSIADIEHKLGDSAGHAGQYVLVTGVLMFPYIADLAERLSTLPGMRARAVKVTNRFYGDSVTVSGLLTGEDIQSALEEVAPHETVVLPPNCLNDSGAFLDDLTPADISDALGVTVMKGNYDPVKVFS